jgi:hypothetical protein
MVEYSPEKAALYHYMDRMSIGILRVYRCCGRRKAGKCSRSTVGEAALSSNLSYAEAKAFLG